MSNYPDGAANDNRAPWHQPKAKWEDCPKCDGSGLSQEFDHDPGEQCQSCDGTGLKEVEYDND